MPALLSLCIAGREPRERKRMCENSENKEQILNEIFEMIGEENGTRSVC